MTSNEVQLESKWTDRCIASEKKYGCKVLAAWIKLSDYQVMIVTIKMNAGVIAGAEYGNQWLMGM